MAPSRRRNGEHIGRLFARGRLVAFPSEWPVEMEAIPASRRDLTKMARCRVGQA